MSCNEDKISHYCNGDNHIIINGNKILCYNEMYLGEYEYSDKSDTSVNLKSKIRNMNREIYFKYNNKKSELETNLMSNKKSIFEVCDELPPKYRFIETNSEIKYLQKKWNYMYSTYEFLNDTVLSICQMHDSQKICIDNEYRYKFGNIFLRGTSIWYPYLFLQKSDSVIQLIDYIDQTRKNDTIDFVLTN